MKSKVIALFLSVLLIAGNLLLLSGCSRSMNINRQVIPNRVVQIEENSLWFDTKCVAIGEEYSEGMDYCYFDNKPIYTGDGIMFCIHGAYSEEGMDLDDEDLSLSMDKVVKYDLSGKLLWDIDLADFINSLEVEESDVIILSNIIAEDERYYVVFEKDNYEYGEIQWILFEIDDNEGVIYDSPIYLDNYDINLNNSWNNYLENIFYVNGYRFELYYSNDNGFSYYQILAIDSDENVNLFDTRELFSDKPIVDIPMVFGMSDNEVALPYYGDEESYIKINTDTMTMTKFNVSDEIKKINPYYFFYINSKVYANKADGVYEVDFNEGTVSRIFSFSDCYINLAAVENLSLLEVKGDEYIFIENQYNYFDNNDKVNIYTLTRSDTNPNAGKIALSLANLGHIDSLLGEAIYKFNTENEQYYIVYDEEYSLDYSQFDGYSDTRYYEENVLNVMDQIYNKLTTDLMAGEGPDIVVGAFDMKGLNRSDYLIDLSNYLSSYDTDNLYTNIIDASREGEEVYQLPLQFSFNSIYGEIGLSSNNLGFTFEEYQDAVTNSFEEDPLFNTDTRLEMLEELLSRMSEPVIDANGNVNLQTEEFEEILNFCSNYADEIDYVEFDMEDNQYSYRNIYINTYYFVEELYNLNLSDKKMIFYGLPSYSGLAPSVTITSSVAISSACTNSDGAWEFVENLLSDEVMAASEFLSISKSAFTNGVNEEIQYFNNEIDEYLEIFTPIDLELFGFPSKHISIDEFSMITKTFESIDSVNQIDMQFYKIVEEEIEAYFTNQKSLEDVILAIETRYQTVIDGRG